MRPLLSRLKIKHKLFLATACIVLACLGVSTWLAWQRGRSNLEQRLTRELLAATTTLATQIDGELHEVIHADAQGKVANQEEFEEIRSQLQKTITAIGLTHRGSPAYTLRPASDFETSGELEFVVMTHPDPATHQFFTGNRYKALPHLIQALRGNPTSTGIYSDGEGTWISAAAPIVAGTPGHAVAVLQMDRAVEEVYAESRQEALKVLGGSLLVLLISLAATAFFASRFTRPLLHLAESTRAVAEGHLETRADWETQDEIGNLVAHFNSMAGHLQQAHQTALRHHAEISDACEKVRSELNQEQALRLETSRRLGMAEVAIGVLHNLGNALNSAKVSSGQLEDLVESIPSSGFQKLTQLFLDQGDQIGQFLSVEEKRRHLLNYASGLSEHLANTQARLSREITDLQTHINAMENLVRDHSAYTGDQPGLSAPFTTSPSPSSSESKKTAA